MSFVETRFPTDIAYGSSGGPEYSTDIVISAGGYEQRNINWSHARARYNVAHGVRTQAQLDLLIAFFRARKGRAHGFRFKDWSDYRAVNQIIGTGDGVTVHYPLIKSYVSGSQTEIRTITKPVAGSIELYLDSVLQASGWSVDFSTGVITFASPPGDGVSIAADFEFDVPVRFDTDRISATIDAYGAHSWLDIPIIEVRT